MKVYRIILLLGFIGAVENQTAPHAVSDASTCEKSKWKWFFVLSPEANEINRLTRLVESVRSAIVMRPKNDSGDVHVIIAPEDFEEFRKKSQLLNVHKTHTLQCIDLSKNSLFNNFPSTSRSEATSKKLVKALEKPKLSRAPSGDVVRSSETKKIEDELCKCSKLSHRPSSKNFTRNSTSNSGEKSWKQDKESRKLGGQTSIVPTIMRRFFVTSGTRAPKVTTKRLNARKMTTKSRERTIGKVRTGQTRPKESGKDKSTENKNSTRRTSLTERPKYNQEKGTRSSARKTTLERSWPNLTSTIPYSLKKSFLMVPSSTESHRNSEKRGKSSTKSSDQFTSFMNAGSLNKMNTMKNLPPKRSKSFETKNTTKSGGTSSAPISQRAKSSRSPITTTKQPVEFSYSRETKESTIFSNATTKKITTTLATKDRKHKRDLASSALGHKCRSKKLKRIKRSNCYYPTSNSAPFEISSGCHVIRITTHCANDESERNYENQRSPMHDSSVNEPADTFPVKPPPWPSVPEYDGSTDEISFGQSDGSKLRKNSKDEIYDFSPNGPNFVPTDESYYSEVSQPIVQPWEKWPMKHLGEPSEIEDYDESLVKFDTRDDYSMKNPGNGDFLPVTPDKSLGLGSGEVHGSTVEDEESYPLNISGYPLKQKVPHRQPLEPLQRPQVPHGRPLKPLKRPEAPPHGRPLDSLPRPKVPPKQPMKPLKRPDVPPGRPWDALPRPEMPHGPPLQELQIPEISLGQPFDALPTPEMPYEPPLQPLQRPEISLGRPFDALPGPEMPHEPPLQPLQRPEMSPGRPFDALLRPEMPHGPPLQPLQRPQLSPGGPLDALPRPEVPSGGQLDTLPMRPTTDSVDYTKVFDDLVHNEDGDKDNDDFSSVLSPIQSIVHFDHELTEHPLKSSSIPSILAEPEEIADDDDDEDNYENDDEDDDDEDEDENYSDDEEYDDDYTDD